MEKEIKDLLDRERFSDLSAEEKAMIYDLCSSDEDYASLKELFAGVEGARSELLRPSERTKRSLDDLFDKTYGDEKKVVWYSSVFIALYPKDRPMHKRPLVQIAAAIIVVLLSVPLLDSVDVVKNKTLTAKQIVIKEKDETANQVQDKMIVQKSPKSDDKPVEQTVVSSGTDESNSTFELEETSVLTAERDFATGDGIRLSAPGAALTEDIFDHPDGIYSGAAPVVSRSARKQLKALDLITPTF